MVLYYYTLSYPNFMSCSLAFCQAHLLDGRASAGASVDSARQNLAATFVNAFVNAGFGQVNIFIFTCKCLRLLVMLTFVVIFVTG